MDIFDEDDLLAIANDSASSSSDAESSSESSSVAIGALQTDEYKSDVNEKQKRNTTSKDSPADEEDSDDEDAGFLDNWLSDSQKHENDVQDVTGRAEGHSSQDGSVASNIELDVAKSKAAVESDGDSSAITPVDETNASLGEITETKEQDEGGIRIHLGQSVLNWITKYNSKKWQQNSEGGLSNGAIVGIHETHSCKEELKSSLMVDLMTADSSERAKSNAVQVEQIAIITPVGDETTASSDMQQFRGDVLSSSSSIVRKSNFSVDCVAIYNKERKCYILEMVDVTVTNLQPRLDNDEANQNIDKTNNEFVADEIPKNIVDPRLLAKRAESQVKQLKRKRKSVDERRSNTKAKTGNAKIKTEDRVN